MIETSAHLVDHVFPEVPVRQWVLSFPWPLRLLFASRPDALGRCLGVIVRAIQTDLAHRAGLTASSGVRTGVVTLIQRFGSALNLNVHLHMLILDGGNSRSELLNYATVGGLPLIHTGMNSQMRAANARSVGGRQ